MTSEFLTTAAAIGTFVVIAATAVAAMVQLRHLRAANQITALDSFTKTYEGAEFRDAFHFVRSELNERLKDPAFRRELRGGTIDRANHPEVVVLNILETWGNYYRYGAIDRHIFVQQLARVMTGFWTMLEPTIALMSERSGGINVAFENFEFFVIEARKWTDRNPLGTFPKGVRRIPLTDQWREVDASRPQS
jgi:hypothetical protein